ncbi:MAG: plasmid partitioning protein RepB C-terminal domain-containing protein [Acidobacteriaceae bacterium]
MTAKYKQIAASLKHLGLIEPLVVFQSGGSNYWLLDGALRFDILKTQAPGTEVRCLLATDDESYNYNKRVNYLPPIAEHSMILKALANGVTEERIAEALDVNVVAIRKKRHLLDGICEEAAELLKDKRVTSDGFTVLRKMKPIRQIYAAEMMVASNNYSTRFVRGLLAVTKPEGLVAPEETYKRLRRTTATQHAVMEQGSDALIEDFKMVEKSYTSDLLSLTIAAGYLRRMLENGRIERHLLKLHPDILQAIQGILATVDEDKVSASSNKQFSHGDGECVRSPDTGRRAVTHNDADSVNAHPPETPSAEAVPRAEF